MYTKKTFKFGLCVFINFDNSTNTASIIDYKYNINIYFTNQKRCHNQCHNRDFSRFSNVINNVFCVKIAKSFFLTINYFCS